MRPGVELCTSCTGGRNDITTPLSHWCKVDHISFITVPEILAIPFGILLFLRLSRISVTLIHSDTRPFIKYPDKFFAGNKQFLCSRLEFHCSELFLGVFIVPWGWKIGLNTWGTHCSKGQGGYYPCQGGNVTLVKNSRHFWNIVILIQI